jgi:hypothetical protein
MKFTKLAILLVGIATLFSACSFEDEIQLDPGTFIVHNNSNSAFDLVIENLNLDGQVENIEHTVDPNSSMNIPLEKGYNYEVKAMEANTGMTLLNTYSTVITVEAHKNIEWTIPTN